MFFMLKLKLISRIPLIIIHFRSFINYILFMHQIKNKLWFTIIFIFWNDFFFVVAFALFTLHHHFFSSSTIITIFLYFFWSLLFGWHNMTTNHSLSSICNFYILLVIATIQLNVGNWMTAFTENCHYWIRKLNLWLQNPVSCLASINSHV